MLRGTPRTGVEAPPIGPLSLFNAGLGPSSSHTNGPMSAAHGYRQHLIADAVPAAAVTVELFGALAATGRGHGTDTAIALGLVGELPATVDVDAIPRILDALTEAGAIDLDGRSAAFDPVSSLTFSIGRFLEGHPNAMTFRALSADGEVIDEQTWLSIGGGFIARAGDETVAVSDPVYDSAVALMGLAEGRERLSDALLEHEAERMGEDALAGTASGIWTAMRECVERGCASDALTLPGPLRVGRRAPALHRQLLDDESRSQPHSPTEWVALYALAVNEENAAGGRVVTAPTNGAAGIIPAVLHHLRDITPGLDDDAVLRFLLVAGAIGLVIKNNASISGADVGCQGEVGSACAMAAGALCDALGGTPAQTENAAEIGLEHHLGLTCDPVGGQVQIPCIERNAVAANTAIVAAMLARRGTGEHWVTLDQAIATMRQTGADMRSEYKETSEGGLAVNVVMC